MRGCLSAHNYASEERLFTAVPKWRHFNLMQIIPKSVLEDGYADNIDFNTQIYLIHFLPYAPCNPIYTRLNKHKLLSQALDVFFTETERNKLAKMD